MAPAESSVRSRLATATRPPLSATKGTGLKGARAAVSTRPATVAASSSRSILLIPVY